MSPFAQLQIHVRERFNRNLLSARFYARRAWKNGLSRDILSTVQTKFPYALPVPRLPYVIGIEPTNTCNLRCIMCPYTTQRVPRGFMAMPLYQRIVEQAKEGGSHRLRFVGLGEPLLHPELPAMIRLAKRAGLYTEITTNATLLTRELGLALLDAGLDEIGFSLDSADPAAFERIRLGAKYDEVIANVETFLELCAAAGSKAPVTVARMVVMDDAEIDPFVRRWSHKVDSLQFNIMKLYAGTQVAKNLKRPKQADGSLESHKTPRCRLVMGYMPICWDGQVRLCNQSNVVIGDANTTPLESIWRGHTLQKIRELHVRREGHRVDVCRGCHVIRPATAPDAPPTDEVHMRTRQYWPDGVPASSLSSRACPS